MAFQSQDSILKARYCLHLSQHKSLAYFKRKEMEQNASISFCIKAVRVQKTVFTESAEYVNSVSIRHCI